MKRKLLVCAIAQACILGTANGSSYEWPLGAGRLAYTVFNLSGNDCNMTPYVAGANPYAPDGSPAQSVGWNSGDSMLSFFNSTSPNAFFYEYFNDPIYPPNQSQTSTLISTFTSGETFETSQKVKAMDGGNAIAIGDSWVFSCPIPGSSGATYVVMANMASAGSGFSTFTGNNETYDNSEIDPPLTASGSNPNGAGFVNNANAVFNFNVDSGASYYQATGGLWSGVQPATISNPASGLPAVNAISAAMYPINLAAYTTSESSKAVSTNYNPIFGGAFTLAIGDPFIVSSFNAKILWFLAASINSPSGNPAFQWNDSSFPFSTSASSGAANQLIAGALGGTCSGCTGVFPTSSNAEGYTKWLMEAPYQAANEVVQSFDAASQPTLTGWGKLFEGLWSVTADALNAAAAVMTGGESEAAQIAVMTSVSATTGGLTPVVDNSISNTFAQPTPTWQTAPLVVNPSYSASNLLGLLMANYAVQSWVQVIGKQPWNPAANPLWANFSIYTDSLCSNLSVTNNLFSSAIRCSGAEQSSLSPAPSYNNVYSTSPGGSQQLNIWDAILTGSNVTVATNQTSGSSEANGMLVLANPLTATFQPPMQIASTNDITYSLVTTNFNITTGTVTLTDAYGYSSPPSTQPVINPYTASYGGGDCSTLSYSPLGITYESKTGILSVAGWQSGCTAQPDFNEGTATSNWSATLNMATCAPGSAVNYQAPGGNGLDGPSSVSLVCANPNPNLVSSNASEQPALDYNQCVADINATGGVVAMPINGVPGLACVCIPSYINGGSENQLVTGISTGPGSSQCPGS